MNINKIFPSRDTRLLILDFLKFVPDSLLLRLEYRMKIGKKLNLKNPRTFNEKLQWLKLHNRKPIYTQMADKYGVREIVKEQIGEQYLVPIIGVWDSVDDIPFELLPEKFVLKCTHDSGSVILCRNKSELNFEEAKNKLEKRLKKNAYWPAREWPYKNIKPRIIAEEFLFDRDNMFLPVYKFFCFNGEPKLIQQIQNDKQENETVDYFDIQWNQQDIKQRFPNSDNPIPKPKNLEIMLELAKKLSINVPFLRVDFYVVNDKILFSEYTFYTDAGYSVFEPEIWDIILGKWITLEQKHEISVKSIGGGRRSLNKKSYQIICNYEKMEMIAA